MQQQDGYTKSTSGRRHATEQIRKRMDENNSTTRIDKNIGTIGMNLRSPPVADRTSIIDVEKMLPSKANKPIIVFENLIDLTSYDVELQQTSMRKNKGVKSEANRIQEVGTTKTTKTQPFYLEHAPPRIRIPVQISADDHQKQFKQIIITDGVVDRRNDSPVANIIDAEQQSDLPYRSYSSSEEAYPFEQDTSIVRSPRDTIISPKNSEPRQLHKSKISINIDDPDYSDNNEQSICHQETLQRNLSSTQERIGSVVYPTEHVSIVGQWSAKTYSLIAEPLPGMISRSLSMVSSAAVVAPLSGAKHSRSNHNMSSEDSGVHIERLLSSEHHARNSERFIGEFGNSFQLSKDFGDRNDDVQHILAISESEELSRYQIKNRPEMNVTSPDSESVATDQHTTIFRRLGMNEAILGMDSMASSSYVSKRRNRSFSRKMIFEEDERSLDNDSIDVLEAVERTVITDASLEGYSVVDTTMLDRLSNVYNFEDNGTFELQTISAQLDKESDDDMLSQIAIRCSKPSHHTKTSFSFDLTDKTQGGNEKDIIFVDESMEQSHRERNHSSNSYGGFDTTHQNSNKVGMRRNRRVSLSGDSVNKSVANSFMVETLQKSVSLSPKKSTRNVDDFSTRTQALYRQPNPPFDEQVLGQVQSPINCQIDTTATDIERASSKRTAPDLQEYNNIKQPNFKMTSALPSKFHERRQPEGSMSLKGSESDPVEIISVESLIKNDPEGRTDAYVQRGQQIPVDAETYYLAMQQGTRQTNTSETATATRSIIKVEKDAIVNVKCQKVEAPAEDSVFTSSVASPVLPGAQSLVRQQFKRLDQPAVSGSDTNKNILNRQPNSPPLKGTASISIQTPVDAEENYREITARRQERRNDDNAKRFETSQAVPLTTEKTQMNNDASSQTVKGESAPPNGSKVLQSFLHGTNESQRAFWGLDPPSKLDVEDPTTETEKLLVLSSKSSRGRDQDGVTPTTPMSKETLDPPIPKGTSFESKITTQSTPIHFSFSSKDLNNMICASTTDQEKSNLPVEDNSRDAIPSEMGSDTSENSQAVGLEENINKEDSEMIETVQAVISAVTADVESAMVAAEDATEDATELNSPFSRSLSAESENQQTEEDDESSEQNLTKMLIDQAAGDLARRQQKAALRLSSKTSDLHLVNEVATNKNDIHAMTSPASENTLAALATLRKVLNANDSLTDVNEGTATEYFVASDTSANDVGPVNTQSSKLIAESTSIVSAKSESSMKVQNRNISRNTSPKQSPQVREASLFNIDNLTTNSLVQSAFSSETPKQQHTRMPEKTDRKPESDTKRSKSKFGYFDYRQNRSGDSSETGNITNSNSKYTVSRSETNASDNNDDATDSKASLVDTLTTDSDLEAEPEGYDTCSLAFAIQILDKTCAWLESEDSMLCGYRSRPSLLTKVKQNGASRRKGKKQGDRYANRAHLFFGKSRRNVPDSNNSTKTIEKKDADVVDSQQPVHNIPQEDPEVKFVSPFARPRRISKKTIEKNELNNNVQPERKASTRRVMAYKNTVSEERKSEYIPPVPKANSFRKFMIERSDDRKDDEIVVTPNSQNSDSLLVIPSSSRNNERNLESEATDCESLFVPILEQKSGTQSGMKYDSTMNTMIRRESKDDTQHLQQALTEDDQQFGSLQTVSVRNDSTQVNTTVTEVSSNWQTKSVASESQVGQSSVVSQRDEVATKTEEATEVRDESIFTSPVQSDVDDECDDECDESIQLNRLEPPEHITTDAKDAASVTYSTVTEAVYSISKFASKEIDADDEDGNDFVMLSREQIIQTTPDNTVVEQSSTIALTVQDDGDDNDDETMATDFESTSKMTNITTADNPRTPPPTTTEQHDTLAQFSTEVTLSPTSNERIISSSEKQKQQQQQQLDMKPTSPITQKPWNKSPEKKLYNSNKLSQLMMERKPLDLPMSSSSFLTNSDHDSTAGIMKNYRQNYNNINTSNGQDDERNTALQLAEKLRRRAAALKQRRKNRTNKRFLQSSNDYDSGGASSPTHSIDSFPDSPKAIKQQGGDGGDGVGRYTTTAAATSTAANTTGTTAGTSTTISPAGAGAANAVDP